MAVLPCLIGTLTLVLVCGNIVSPNSFEKNSSEILSRVNCRNLGLFRVWWPYNTDCASLSVHGNLAIAIAIDFVRFCFKLLKQIKTEIR